MVTGTLGKEPIENGRLRGAEMFFTVGKAAYTGRVEGNRLRVSATVDGQPIAWTATALPALAR
jgi:hypothetical protein